MAELPLRIGDDADTALLQRARAGDSDAFGELYTREVDAARRLARILVGEQGADELVSESFARVLTQLQAGRGPTDDFRAYLHVTIRNGFRDGLRATKESPSSDQPWLLDDVLPPVEELVEDLDREVAVTALATLPKSWQQVLWHLEVEGRKPAEVATILDMDAGAVSSLAYRAREGLKRAYLDQHFQPTTGGQCGWTQSRMSQYVRGDLSPRAQQKVADHLDDCDACAAAFVAVDRVNQKLAAWLFPVVLWGLASANKGGLLWFAGAAGAGAAGATGTPISTPSGSTAGAGANPVVLGAAAAAVAAAVAGGVAFALVAGDDKAETPDTSADVGPVDPGGPGGQAPPPGGSDDPKDPQQPPPSDTASELPAIAPPTDAATTTVPTPTPTETPTQPTTEPPGPTTEPTDPSTPPSTEPPAPIAVAPEPPVEVDIADCGTDGSLELADTTGVIYDLTVGNGLEGPWEVDATADDGYVIADGATTHFEGDLGTPYPCVHISDFDAKRNGPPLLTPWELTTELAVGDPTPATLRADYDFDVPVLLISKPTNWACTGNLIGTLFGPVSCTFPYTGAAPPEIVLEVIAVSPNQHSGPPGSLTVYSDGHVVDQASF